MKSTLFIRPNLKLLMLAAIALLALEHFFNPGESDSGALLMATTIQASALNEQELDRIVETKLRTLNYDNYMLISNCYRKLGNSKKAMQYLRRAGIAATIDELD